MMDEPEEKYAMAFFDGQNLFRHAKDAFGHHHPNYDPIKLHAAVCETNGWLPNLVRFYTGVPDPARSPMWARYWNNRVIALKRSGVHVTTRKIRYREDHVDLPSGIRETVLTTQEKGIDVRVEAVNPRAWMTTSVPYWEGPVRITGSHGGRGYLEMTGY